MSTHSAECSPHTCHEVETPWRAPSMNAACGWTLIRKTSLLRKINPMMRRSSFTNKDIYNSHHLAMMRAPKRPGDSDWHQRIASQIPNSDQSPLYDVRNPARCVRLRRQRAK